MLSRVHLVTNQQKGELKVTSLYQKKNYKKIIFSTGHYIGPHINYSCFFHLQMETMSKRIDTNLMMRLHIYILCMRQFQPKKNEAIRYDI